MIKFKKKNKQKNKNRYIPFKKTIKPLLTILMVVLAILITIYTIDYKKFKQLHTKVYDESYIIHVLYLVMDKDNVPADINLHDTFHGDIDYDESILMASSSMIPLTRKGDYLYADLDRFTNPELLRFESDYAFTKNNNEGELIDGCFYDKKNNIIKVPVSYFEDPTYDKELPIQLEIETLMQKTKFNHLETNVNIKKFLTKEKTISNAGGDVSTHIDLKTLGLGKISTKDLHVYVNDSKVELEEEMLDVEDNILDIALPALQIRSLDVKVDINIRTVLAATKRSSVKKRSSSSWRAITVNAPINTTGLKGKKFNLSKSSPKEYQYCTSGCTLANDGRTYIFKESAANYYYTYAPYSGGYTTGNAKMYAKPYTYKVNVNALIKHIGQVSGNPDLKKVGTLKGTNQTWLAFYCLDHTTKNGKGALTMKITSVYKGKNYVVLGFKSTEARGSQYAGGYLKFKWAAGGFKVRKTDDTTPTAKAIQGLKIVARNMDDPTKTYTVATDSSGYATFTNLSKTSKYEFYEDCSSLVTYNSGFTNYTGKTLDQLDISCSHDSNHPLNNGGAGYIPEDVVSKEIRSKYLFIGDEFYGNLLDSENDNQHFFYSIGTNNIILTVDNSSPNDWYSIDPDVGAGTIGQTSVTLPQASDVDNISVMLGLHGITEIEEYKGFLNNLHTRYPNVKIIVTSVLHVNESVYTAVTNTQIDDFNTAIKDFCVQNNTWCTFSDVTTSLEDVYSGVDQVGELDESDFEGDDGENEEGTGISDENDDDSGNTEEDETTEEGEGEVDDEEGNYNKGFGFLNNTGYLLTDEGNVTLFNVVTENLPFNSSVTTVGGLHVLETISNTRYRMCLVVSKTKGTSKRPEKNTTFKITIPASKCRNYPSGYNQTFVTGDGTNGELGFVTVTGLGACNPGTIATATIMDDAHKRTVIGPDHNTVSLIRSEIKVITDNGLDYDGIHYNKGDTVVMTDLDFEQASQAGFVEETCPKTNVLEFEDKGYIVLWKKFNQTLRTNGEGSPMPNIQFTLKKGNETMRVKKQKYTYTDVADETHTCYEYTDLTDNTTTDILETDADGLICVYNLPDTEPSVYTITEVASEVYDNQTITATSSEEFSNYTNTKYLNYEYLIDWNKKEFKNDKTSNSNGNLEKTKFTVADSTNVIVKTKPNKETVYDKNGTTKSCYVVDVVTPANNTNSVFESDADGYTCIVGLNKNTTYTITETDPAKYYAYANVRTITEDSKLVFNSANPNPKTIYQCPTEVKITKTTTELGTASEEYKKVIYEELQKLTFNVLDSNGNVLRFKWNNVTKHYEYQEAVNDLTGTNDTGITELRLLNGIDVQSSNTSDMNLDILINYLPEGNYIFREVSSINCGATSSSPSDGSNCTCEGNTTNTDGQSTLEEVSCSNMGYAHIADIPFTVTDNNNGSSLTCDKADNSVKISVTNKPTEVRFTKEDIYGYYNDTDVVKFENDEEIEAFDNITFRVRKQSTANLSGISSIDNSVYEWFYKTKDGEYRYDVLHKCTSEGQVVGSYTCTQNLHTDDGDMLLTHLCKCESYYIEEYEVPDGTVFILPKLEGNTCESGYMEVSKNGKLECHPIIAVKVCDCDDEHPESSPPVKIDDFPTKQSFIKKDLKYNTIITDQRTTFELFLTSEEAAAAGRLCNPYNAESKANDCIQVYFSERVVLADEADGSYSYRMNPDQSSANKIKDLHVDPNTGKLIFRYLPSYIDREYVLMETKAPRGYDLPSGEKSLTRFKVLNDTINVEVSNVPNRPSKAIIGKYDLASGKLIPGVRFKIYKVNNYDENLTAMMQSRTELSFKTIRDGSYEYREVFDTNIITTCINKDGSPCSDITNTLVDDTYENTDLGILEKTTTIQEGQALIQYLDTDAYYVIEEVEAPEGYELPSRESDRYTLFYIPESKEVTKETKIYNTETYFTFFKYDEFNKVKDGAVFKLQKLNDDKIYEDVAVEDVSTEETKMYRVMSTSENYDITTMNGQATIYRLTEGQYRIIETKAPDGYELPKKTYNVVTFLVDKNGHTYGSNIIANKQKTTKLEIVPTAQAELIVNIQTGKTVIKYGLIITGILGLIGLLIFIRKKVSK